MQQLNPHNGYAHGQLKISSRSAQGTLRPVQVTLTVSSRYAHGQLKVRSRSGQGALTVSSTYAHGQLKIRSRSAQGTLIVRALEPSLATRARFVLF